MKKYIIKYADGGAQYHMEAEHKSRKEAGETLMNYLCSRSNPINGCYPSPFDFILEEVDVKDVNETIIDFESARKALGADFTTFNNSQFKDGLDLMDSINPKHIEVLTALTKLFTIAEAWNKEDGFVPDFSDYKQVKWFPWFSYDRNLAKFVYSYTDCTYSSAPACLGSKLCFKTRERAEQFGKQFVDLYNKVFL